MPTAVKAARRPNESLPGTNARGIQISATAPARLAPSVPATCRPARRVAAFAATASASLSSRSMPVSVLIRAATARGSDDATALTSRYGAIRLAGMLLPPLRSGVRASPACGAELLSVLSTKWLVESVVMSWYALRFGE